MASTLADRCDAIARLLADDRRYRLGAYQFVEAGLAHAQMLARGQQPETIAFRRDRREEGRPMRHISGAELCFALRDLAHRQYGRLAHLVLASWGIHSTSDFGEIVYNLIRIGKLSKSSRDQREHFDNVFDLKQALLQDFAIRKE